MNKSCAPGRLNGVVVAIFLGLLTMAGSQRASAHQDPPNCQTGVQLDLKVFRADGTTPAQGGEVSPCETLKYQITLTDPPGRCAFQGGKLFVIFPTRA